MCGARRGGRWRGRRRRWTRRSCGCGASRRRTGATSASSVPASGSVLFCMLALLHVGRPHLSPGMLPQTTCTEGGVEAVTFRWVHRSVSDCALELFRGILNAGSPQGCRTLRQAPALRRKSGASPCTECMFWRRAGKAGGFGVAGAGAEPAGDGTGARQAGAGGAQPPAGSFRSARQRRPRTVCKPAGAHIL